VKELEEEIFLTNATDKQVKILGMVTTHRVDELHVYVNGVDITKSVVLDVLKITVEKKSA
jgi:hypothetical protein